MEVKVTKEYLDRIRNFLVKNRVRFANIKKILKGYRYLLGENFNQEKFLQITTLVRCYREVLKLNSKDTVRFERKRDSDVGRELSFEVC